MKELPEPLRLRLKIAKTGKMRFLSHAEFSRTIILAARRSGLPLVFSGRDKRRVKLSLSPPLPMGMTSEGELVDLMLSSYVPAAEAAEMLERSLHEGLEVAEARLIGGGAKPVGKLIDTASYHVVLPEGAGKPEAWEKAVEEFLAKEVVEFERVQPRRTRVLDIRPGVHRLEAGSADGSTVALDMVVKDGVGGTVKPWEVIRVLARTCGLSEQSLEGADIERTGLYSRRRGRLVSPMETGRGKPAV